MLVYTHSESKSKLQVKYGRNSYVYLYLSRYKVKSYNVLMSSIYNDSPCDFISDVARVILSYKYTDTI